ncbi:hypothetical protein STEG23_029158, partial [Scotinomys teguina]
VPVIDEEAVEELDCMTYEVSSPKTHKAIFTLVSGELTELEPHGQDVDQVPHEEISSQAGSIGRTSREENFGEEEAESEDFIEPPKQHVMEHRPLMLPTLQNS